MGGKPSVPIVTSATSTLPQAAQSVPFLKDTSLAVRSGTTALFVISLTLFLVGYFAVPDTGSGNVGLKYSSLVLGGIGAFLITPLALFWMSKYSENVKVGNWGILAAVVIVSVIGFLLVFAPAIGTGITDPWAITVIVLVGIIALGATLAYAIKQSNTSVLADIFSRLSQILFFFLPYTLITFGPIVDIITHKFQFLPASVVGISGIFINWILATFLNNGVPPASLDPSCEIPGLLGFSSNITPQPMMVSLSILSYIATYLSRSTLSGKPATPTTTFINPSDQIWPAWALYGGVASLYLIVLLKSNCLTFQGFLKSLILPTVYGSLFGILGFEFLAPRYDPTGQFPSNTPPVLGKIGSTTPSVGTCSAGSSDGEFICESFENGKLKRTTMTE